MGGPTCGYHLTAKAVSFGKGGSAVHAAAYNARSKPLEHEREEKQTNDYSRAGGLLFSGIFAPKDAPEWVRDREELWNRAEAAERQWNGQPARSVVMAFPDKLDQQQREWLIKDFVREQFVRKGMVADVNIHAPHRDGDERNFHAHILLTMREIDGDGFATTKNRDWNSRTQLVEWREKWAEMGGRALERAGHEVEANRWRHGHETLTTQRKAALEFGDREFAETLNREPTTHRGPHVDAMDRKGIETERGNAYHDTVQRNNELLKLRAELAGVEKHISEVQQQKQREVPDHLRGVMRGIWEARQQSDSGKAFAAALQEQNILLARVTKQDADRQQKLQQQAESRGVQFLTLREGDVVAVTKRGDLYRLNERTSGETWKDNQKFTAGVQLESVAYTREIMGHVRDQEAQSRKPIPVIRLDTGPRSQSMASVQQWAQEKAKEHDERQRREAQNQPRPPSMKRAEEEIDPQRMRTDPTYRKEMRDQAKKIVQRESSPNQEKKPPGLEPELER